MVVRGFPFRFRFSVGGFYSQHALNAHFGGGIRRTAHLFDTSLITNDGFGKGIIRKSIADIHISTDLVFAHLHNLQQFCTRPSSMQ